MEVFEVKYIYPATMSEEDGVYLVRFTDIDEISTFGKTLYEAVEMAEDALNLMLVDMEESGDPIPKASDIRDIKLDDPKSFVTLIKADTDEYRKMLANMPKNEDK